MPKNIVLLSDGTGNSAAKLFRTNVWRTYEALDLSGSDQIAFYHDGVGTSTFAILAALGGAIGWGLKRNVLDLYAYLCDHYEPGDRLYAFGFSRGAFTIRVLIGLITNQGIIRHAPTGEVRRLSAWAYRKYRRTYNPTGWLVTPLRWLRDVAIRGRDALLGRQPYSSVKRHHLKRGEFTFVGVWDTVDAYGLPIDELTDGIDQWVWPLSIPSIVPSPIIGKGCHALALDDERQTFHPVLWDERKEDEERQEADHIDKERITQVWFAGMHANVGGGYADDRLAHVSFRWMADQAARRGLKLLDERLAVLSAQADKLGRLYDSRSGFGGYYRYCPRTSMITTYGPATPPHSSRYKIHESVFERIQSDQGYAPIVLPPAYAVVQRDGAIRDFVDTTVEPTNALRAQRLAEQEFCWDLVWWKRIAYFATIGMTAFLLLRPAGLGPDPELAPKPIWLSGLVGILGAFAPSLASPLVAYFQRYPLELFGGSALIFFLMSIGAHLQTSIANRMCNGWSAGPVKQDRSRGIRHLVVHDWVRALRTSMAYRRSFFFVTAKVVPFLFGGYVLVLILTLLNRAAFEAVSSSGCFCAPSAAARELTATPTPIGLTPAEFCQPTGVLLKKSATYRVDVALPTGADTWRDGAIAVTSPAGIALTARDLSLVRRGMFAAALPARRIFRAEYLTPIARIGSDGADHYVLSASCTTFKARKDGELFLFVNDAVLPVRPQLSSPWLITGWSAYYSNNRGGPATVTIRAVAHPELEDLAGCRADVGMRE